MALETSVAIVISAIVSAFIAGLFAILTSYKTRTYKHQEVISEHRMKSYPLLYEILSAFLKKIELGIHSCDEHDFSLTKTDVIIYLHQFNAWDSKNACWVSDSTSKMLHIYRHWLSEQLHMSPDEFCKSFSKGSALREKLILRTGLIESNIRDELGARRYSVIPVSSDKQIALSKAQLEYTTTTEEIAFATIFPYRRRLRPVKRFITNMTSWFFQWSRLL